MAFCLRTMRCGCEAVCGRTRCSQRKVGLLMAPTGGFILLCLALHSPHNRRLLLSRCCSYLHTVVVFIALCLFAFEIYAVPNTGLGSPGSVWEHLTAIATFGGAYKGVSRARALCLAACSSLCECPAGCLAYRAAAVLGHSGAQLCTIRGSAPVTRLQQGLPACLPSQPERGYALHLACV
jgi:hypothetical protein